MKTIKCDRCGKDIPYVPPYMNAVHNGIIPPDIMMVVWEPLSQNTRSVDLCSECKTAVYNFIFDHDKNT